MISLSLEEQWDYPQLYFEILTMINMTWKGIRTWIYKNLFWLLIIFSILILWISSGITNQWWNNILEKTGIAILSSGVFASVLKSIQFTGIFKDELSKVMLETDFIPSKCRLHNDSATDIFKVSP